MHNIDVAYPAINDYALIGDCHSAALVSKQASIDWACMPRMDAASVFGRLLDWEQAGFCQICPTATSVGISRRYLDDTLVLETRFETPTGTASVTDFFAMRKGGRENPRRRLVRRVRGETGRVGMEAHIRPRFDYGLLRPWIREHGNGAFTAIGGDDGLIIYTDLDLQPGDAHDLHSAWTIGAADTAWIAIEFSEPHRLDPVPDDVRVDVDALADELDETVAWWHDWITRPERETVDADVTRSAMVLKALNNAPTGAFAAAPTTSLPETPGGERNWDYRFSWIRDSWLVLRSLSRLGYRAEADGFRRFIERSSAGSPDQLQLMFGIFGSHRMEEIEISELHGYRGARPVRVGNAARRQLQLDIYGELVDLAWQHFERTGEVDADYWRYLVQVIDSAAELWLEPDHGIWEVRCLPRDFVFSKVMCWAALERGLTLADRLGRDVPADRWRCQRDRIRADVDEKGWDPTRRTYVQAFGSEALDAANLLLPRVGFVAYTDPRFVGTTDAIIDTLDENGYVRRYDLDDDGLSGHEGTFLPCTFWLVEALAHQGRVALAREYFDRAVSTGNDLGLFAEECDAYSGQLLGNFPQALTHVSHISAALALRDAGAG